MLEMVLALVPIKGYNAARDVLAAIHGVQLEKENKEATVESAGKKKKK